MLCCVAGGDDPSGAPSQSRGQTWALQGDDGAGGLETSQDTELPGSRSRLFMRDVCLKHF